MARRFHLRRRCLRRCAGRWHTGRTRAYRFADNNRSTTIYEPDAAETQARKRKCLQAARIRIPAAVRFAVIDFMQEAPGEPLQRDGFSLDEKTLFLWEGVSCYLDGEIEAFPG